MAAAKIHDAVVSDDLNYEIWAPIAKTTLTEKGLWDVVENGVPPDPSKVPELAATIQAEELSKWRDLAMKDMKALHILQSSLTDSAFRKTLSAASAKDLWDLLQKGNDTEEAKLRRLEKQFEELSMDEGELINPYIDRVIEIVEQLRRFKIEKSDYQVIEKVLASLSGSYDGVAPLLGELMDLKKMSLESFVDFFYTFDSITDESIHLMLKANRLRAMAEESCGLCNKNNHNQEDCSSSIPRAGKPSGARQSKPEKGKCFQCGERGHKAKDCNKKIQQPAATEAQIDGQEVEIEVDYLLLAKLTLNDFTYDENMWMIYGHATNHMTPYEKLFTTLDRTYKAKVGLEDGSVLMVEGRGDVKIKMKKGKQKTITNVIFVPALNRNVLSVRQMTSRGCSFTSGARGECIVRDRTGKEFGDTLWDERGLSLRLQVIEGNRTS